jgi:integrase
LDRVRDLFLLEIYTGQRFSDIPQVLDLSDDVEESINIYQKKTFGKAFIPIHSTLKNHLKNIKDKNYTEITSITLQKFNDYLKEIAQLAEMNRKHKWKILVGKEQISKEEFRYNLITSHTGRRTFCTLALKNGIDRETIMKVTGHKTYEQFRKYVKVDEEDMDDAFENFLTK